jgi:hypothetical protein
MDPGLRRGDESLEKKTAAPAGFRPGPSDFAPAFDLFLIFTEEEKSTAAFLLNPH